MPIHHINNNYIKTKNVKFINVRKFINILKWMKVKI